MIEQNFCNKKICGYNTVTVPCFIIQKSLYTWNNCDIARSSDEAKSLLIQKCTITDGDKESIRQEVKATLYFIFHKFTHKLCDFVQHKDQERGVTNT